MTTISPRAAATSRSRSSCWDCCDLAGQQRQGDQRLVVPVVDPGRRREGGLGKVGHDREEAPVTRLLAEVRVGPGQRRGVIGPHLAQPHDVPRAEPDGLAPGRCRHHRILSIALRLRRPPRFPRAAVGLNLGHGTAASSPVVL